MTLLLTDIYCLDSLSHSCIIFAADRRISQGNKYTGSRKKIFQVPYLRAGVGYFGIAEVPCKQNTLAMSEWLLRFIRENSILTDLKSFASALANKLNSVFPPKLRQKNISGFHIAGYNHSGLPEFWFVRNVKDDRITITGAYEAREDFLNNHVYSLGYDGQNPRSVQSGTGQTYRNGDIRAHVVAWEKFDEAFGGLLNEPDFKKLKTVSDLEEWSKFKLELISYFYKNYCKRSLIGRPIDTFSIEGRCIQQITPADEKIRF